MARVLGVIPAKGRSRRVSGKNMRLFGGRPLLDHAIAAACQAERLDAVCVTSESEDILAYAQRVDVEYLRRDPAMSADDVHASVPVIDALERLGGPGSFDYCVMLLPTFPLRRPETIDAVVALAVNAGDSVLSVSPLHKSMYHLRIIREDGRARHVTPEKWVNFQSQDAPALHAINGCCYCAPSGRLIAERSFHTGDPLAYVMDPIEAWDIDTEDDLRIAERLLAAWPVAPRCPHDPTGKTRVIRELSDSR